MKKECVVCGKEIFGQPHKKYCSHKCLDHAYYERNKKKIINKINQWKKDNPLKLKSYNKKAMKKLREKGYFKERLKEYYHTNKNVHDSRSRTLKILKGQSYKIPDLPTNFNQCKNCGSIENLQIHHEIYPLKKKEIVKAINKSKIYYLCKRCHKKHHNSVI